MPGQPLDLDLPSLSDTMADVVSKIVIALSAIEDDLEPKVLPSEFDVNAALSMAGNALTEVGSVQLVAGNVPTAAGSFYYDEDGEHYLVTAAGTVRVTLDGELDMTDTGGFVGDYGDGTEAASYDNASGEFRFTEDTGVYADIVCDDVVLHSATGSVRLTVDDAITTDRSFGFKDLPASGVSALVFNATDDTVESAENTRITHDVLCTNVDANGYVDITGQLYHGDRTVMQGIERAISGTVSTGGAYIPQYTISGGTDPLVGFDAPLLSGVSRIKSVALTIENNTQPTLSLVFVTTSPTISLELTTGLGITRTTSAVGATHTRCLFTVDDPNGYLVPADARALFKINNTAGSDLKVGLVEVVYHAPKP